jgi:hypothetical protein
MFGPPLAPAVVLMGKAIDRCDFVAQDYESFEARLHESLDVLGELLERPGFGVGPKTIGAELELQIIDERGRPLPANLEVRQSIGDPCVTLEIGRSNIELNMPPTPLAGRPFTQLERQIAELTTKADAACSLHKAKSIAIGILPTIDLTHVDEGMLTPTSRFRVLVAGVRRLRGSGANIVHVEGRYGRCLDLVTESVSLAGANTSFQVHLRVTPAEFAGHYNATQMAIAPVLAVSGNSPFFVGHDLWEETRIALIGQSFDARSPSDRWRTSRVGLGDGWCRNGAHELFAHTVAQFVPIFPIVADESPRDELAAGRVPRLQELRLQQGSVWPWNRAVYDDADGGHLRIEMRALPAGPTCIDMAANAAFLLGLTLGLAPQAKAMTAAMTFDHARHNLFEAARLGLDGNLLWPAERGISPRMESARSLVRRLIPIARQGLLSAGVAEDELGPLLAIIEARAKTGQTGARWQRSAYEARVGRLGPQRAFEALVLAYAALSNEGGPVHTWRSGQVRYGHARAA